MTENKHNKTNGTNCVLFLLFFIFANQDFIEALEKRITD